MSTKFKRKISGHKECIGSSSSSWLLLVWTRAKYHPSVRQSINFTINCVHTMKLFKYISNSIITVLSKSDAWRTSFKSRPNGSPQVQPQHMLTMFRMIGTCYDSVNPASEKDCHWQWINLICSIKDWQNDLMVEDHDYDLDWRRDPSRSQLWSRIVITIYQ